MGSTLEMVLTIIGLSFWLLFPIGMFLSVSRIDKNTDQVVRLDKLRQYSEAQEPVDKYRHYDAGHFDWHHPILHFKRWLHEP
ncbi:MAG: hypothetical protein NDI69_14525 [Bacteriovoracaceae bacterium]|nr:hypothetical protein [Bacteriovoracaceae bacterium]